MERLINHPKFQAFDADGDPLSGGKIYTYDGGTVTPKTTYSDRSLSTPNPNPVILDSRGEAVVYCTGLLKLVLKDSSDVLIYTIDNLRSIDRSVLSDEDDDTKIQAEESADEDKLRFDTAGVERAVLDGNQFELFVDEKIKKATPLFRLTGTEGSAVDCIIQENAGKLLFRKNTGTEEIPVWSTVMALDLVNSDLEISALTLNGTLLTATAAEINTVADGDTAKNNHTHDHSTKGQVFTSSGTWTKPANVTAAWVLLAGGGGGGDDGPAGNGGGGGGGGEVVTGLFPVTGDVSITIDAGGAAATPGGTSSFGAIVSALGGSAGSSDIGGDGGGSAGGAGRVNDIAGGDSDTIGGYLFSRIGGGGGGGGYDITAGKEGGDCLTAGGAAGGASGGGGGGGSFGAGGAGGTAGAPDGTAGAANTGGGGGGKGVGAGAAGAGGSGYCAVYWVE